MPTSSLTTLACRLAAIRIDLRAMQRVQMAEALRNYEYWVQTANGGEVEHEVTTGAGGKWIANEVIATIGGAGKSAWEGVTHHSAKASSKAGGLKGESAPKAATPRKTPEQKASEHAAQIHQALEDWKSGRAYYGKGNYRIHVGDEKFLGKFTGKSVMASWNKAAKLEFPDVDALHRAAHEPNYTPKVDFSRPAKGAGKATGSKSTATPNRDVEIAAGIAAQRAYRDATAQRDQILRDMEQGRRTHPYDTNFTTRYKAEHGFADIVAKRRQAAAAADKVAKTLTHEERQRLYDEMHQHTEQAPRSSSREEQHHHYEEAFARGDLLARQKNLPSESPPKGSSTKATGGGKKAGAGAAKTQDNLYGTAKNVTLPKSRKGETIYDSPMLPLFLHEIQDNPRSKSGDGAVLVTFPKDVSKIFATAGNIEKDRELQAAEQTRRDASPVYRDLRERG